MNCTKNSTHKAEVVLVKLEKHENADSLSVVRVYGYPVVVKTADWQDGMLGAYLPPDSMADTERPEFAFLANGKDRMARIRAKKFRGVQSFGLLVHAPAGSKPGDDVAELLNVGHYDPMANTPLDTGGEAESAPTCLAQLAAYDIESLRRYPEILIAGEQVHVTEKIHGANARFAYVDGRMYCGSRTQWKRHDPRSIWWMALEQTPEIEAFCQTHPYHVVYGEVYGDVQCLRYDMGKRQVAVAAFDILKSDGTFMDSSGFRMTAEAYGIPAVPTIYAGPYDFEHICSLAEGKSAIASHVREGCVVKPVRERWHQAVGRVALKVVGAGYLEKC